MPSAFNLQTAFLFSSFLNVDKTASAYTEFAFTEFTSHIA